MVCSLEGPSWGCWRYVSWISSAAVYLSNIERQLLGLIEYGSFVPDEVVAEARLKAQQLLDELNNQLEQRAAEDAAAASGEAVLQQISKRRRARTPAGKFIPDDPATPDVDEAFEPKEPVAEQAAPAEPVAEEPVVTEEPPAEEVVTEEPVIEEPAPVEPPVEEPVAEEPPAGETIEGQ